MTRSLKHLFLCTTLALLAACGSQESTFSDKDIPAAGVNIASAAPNNIANNTTNTPEKEQTAPESKLLSSLATTYPNGQLPAERAAQAALDLAQNPAALKQTMKQTAPIQAQSAPIEAQSGLIQPQSGSIQPQAFTVPRVTSTDYLPVQRIQNTTLYGAYFFSIYSGEVTSALAGNPNWRLEGPAFWASLATGVELNPVHRFQNKQNGSYLYTIYDGERANIVANYSATFTYEGIAWYARQTPATGWSALYRFRNKTNGTYLFSAYESEKNAIVANYPEVFELEGIAYYVRQDAPSAAVVNPIAMGSSHACALKSNGTVNCWGSNGYGQLGVGPSVNFSSSPIPVPGLTGVASLIAGRFNTCAVKADGTAACWGSNAYGQIDYGTSDYKFTPTVVRGLTGLKTMALGYDHICALKTDGTVNCMGRNNYGQLGVGNTNDTPPTALAGLTGVTALVAGHYHTCALVSDGTVRCWGNNQVGQLGEGTYANRPSPTKGPDLTGVISLAAGSSHTCAIKNNGKAYCWGLNLSGQLGNDDQLNKNVPTLIRGGDTLEEYFNGLSQVVTIKAGADHTCAVKSDGTVSCWGGNANFQLGNGTQNGSLLAKAVPNLTGVASLAAGENSNCVLKTDGKASCWGFAGAGQLGDGTDGTSSNPAVPSIVLGGAVYWK